LAVTAEWVRRMALGRNALGRVSGGRRCCNEQTRSNRATEAQHSEASSTEPLNAPSGDALLEADAAHALTLHG
jgi:predicted NBD/HSP70 family sugar kinase